MSGQDAETNVEKTTNTSEKCEIKKEEEKVLSKTDENREIKTSTPLENDSGSKKKSMSPFLSSVTIQKQETGEEDNSSIKKQHEQIDKVSKDRTIFNSTGKLYFKSSKTGKMETRGEGKFLMIRDDAKMYKLMMIRDQVMLKGCNHFISPACPLTKATQVKNSWIWTALYDQSDAEKNEEKTLYFATFKDEETSKLFEEKYKEAQAENLKTIEAKKSSEKENK